MKSKGKCTYQLHHRERLEPKMLAHIYYKFTYQLHLQPQLIDARVIIYGMDARRRYIPRVELMIQSHSTRINEIKEEIYRSRIPLRTNYRHARHDLRNGRASSVYPMFNVDDSITFKRY